jgi:hypothetical protein
MCRDNARLLEKQYKPAAVLSLTLPQEKSVDAYNISIRLCAPLGSIAAGANFVCCSAYAAFWANRAVGIRNASNVAAVGGRVRRWLPSTINLAHTSLHQLMRDTNDKV